MNTLRQHMHCWIWQPRRRRRRRASSNFSASDAETDHVTTVWSRTPTSFMCFSWSEMHSGNTASVSLVLLPPFLHRSSLSEIVVIKTVPWQPWCRNKLRKWGSSCIEFMVCSLDHIHMAAIFPRPHSEGGKLKCGTAYSQAASITDFQNLLPLLPDW